MIREYANKTAVITGAANGLGRALAHELVRRRCNVALIDIDEPSLLDTQSHLKNSSVKVTAHPADVRSPNALGAVAKEILNAHTEVHLLINNAAISASAAFQNFPAEDFARGFEVNYFGVVNGCRVFLPMLHGGQILNVSSCFAWTGYRGKTMYASSKAAIRAFSESLRLELESDGIGVTVLYPGPLATGLVRDGFSDTEERKRRELNFVARRALPLERVARRCLDRLLKNPGRIVIGFDYHMIDLVSRFSPALASRLSRNASKRYQF